MRVLIKKFNVIELRPDNEAERILLELWAEQKVMVGYTGGAANGELRLIGLEFGEVKK